MITFQQRTPERTAARRPLVRQLAGASDLPFDVPPFVPRPVDEPIARPFPLPVPSPALPTRTKGISGASFVALWLFIGLVSSVDAALTVKHQESLAQLEQNPIARQLLEREEWNPGTFIGAKFLGTILVLGFLAFVHRRHQAMAQAVAAGLALFQFALLLFLTL